MISIEEALEKVQKTVQPTAATIQISVREGLGFVLSEDIYSPMDMPPFRQSAMDGYAVYRHQHPVYKVVGEIKAGDPAEITLKPGEAVRIFTGARVPETADAVVIQEKVDVTDKGIRSHETPQKGQNIRPAGEQVKSGQLALSRGTKITPAAIGFLASLGLDRATFYKKPAVAIVVTGDELTPTGEALADGKIYESNSTMLNTALNSTGYNDVVNYHIKDDYKATLKALKNVLQKHDMTIISGGISVGDYDFVGRALEELGVQQHFYKVRQKPGKPLYFGSLNGNMVFALPGNPAASLSCYYLYVLKALERMSGNTNHKLNRVKAPCQEDFEAKGDRPQFLKARYNNENVTILEGQNSSMLHSFAVANALVFKPETTTAIRKGDLVETILLP